MGYPPIHHFTVNHNFNDPCENKHKLFRLLNLREGDDNFMKYAYCKALNGPKTPLCKQCEILITYTGQNMLPVINKTLKSCPGTNVMSEIKATLSEAIC